jgi:ubiquinone/menaquinone biosynthesis C-methylase UbiE
MQMNELKDELIRHGQFKKEDMEKHYDDVAEKYEDIYLRIGFYDHIKCREMTESLFPDVQTRENLKICDMGCGTGLVGEEMYNKGFRNIIGIDLSQGMLTEASKKCEGKAYYELVQQALGSPATFPDS